MKPRLARALQAGLSAAWKNRVPMLIIQALIGVVVLGYYFIPAVQRALEVLGLWQNQLGIYFPMISNALAGAVLAELALVYGKQAGRWTWDNGHDICFKLVLFGVSGGIAYEFYHFQAYCFGNGHDLATIVKKVLVDQFIFSVFWATPFQTLATQWKNQGYSPTRLWSVLTFNFVIDTMLSVMVMTWMFWTPTITLVYFMPLMLQVPLAIFANAIWAILLVAISKVEMTTPVAPERLETESSSLVLP